MATRFAPVQLCLLDGGKTMRDADILLQGVVDDMIAYADKYGSAADGATGEITLSVKIKIEDAHRDEFSIESGIKQKVPGAPVHVVTAMADFVEGADGIKKLHIRNTGAYDPNQMTLFEEVD